MNFWNNYATKYELDLEAIVERMEIKWSPPTMLEVFFNQLEDRRKFIEMHDSILTIKFIARPSTTSPDVVCANKK